MTAKPALTVIEGTPRSPIGPALELAALGCGLTGIAFLLGRLPAWFTHLGVFQGLYLLAFCFYALALLRSRRYEWIPHVGLAVFAVALAARIALLPSAPSLSADVDRYVWEGKVVVHGGNPYRQSPLDPALAPLRDRAIYPAINHPELATIYPPVAIGGFALVALLSPTVAAMKIWVVGHDLILVGLLLLWAQKEARSAATVIAYAWNPLVLVEYAGSGHHDPTALVWLVLAFMLAEERPVLSALSLAAGVLVKLAPLLALPFLWTRWSARARIVGSLVIAGGLAWFFAETRSTYSGLIAYWGTWRNNELFFHLLERATGDFRIARTVTLLGIVGAVVFALIRRWRPARATRFATGAALLTAPVVHPWYLGWELIHEPRRISAPWILLSLTAVLNYGVFRTPREGRDFHLPLAWRWIEYGLPLLLALALTLRSRRAPAGSD
jgi:hypothetical protein